MKRDRKSKLEYHLYARFPQSSCGVRIAVTLSEKQARILGSELNPFTDEVWYRIKERRPDTKPYRRPKSYRDHARFVRQLRKNAPQWRPTL